MNVKLTCVIRYQIDPFQREAFKEYAQNWDASSRAAVVTWLGIFFLTKGPTMWPGGWLHSKAWLRMKRTEHACGKISKGVRTSRWRRPSNSFFGKRETL